MPDARATPAWAVVDKDGKILDYMGGLMLYLTKKGTVGLRERGSGETVEPVVIVPQAEYDRLKGKERAAA